ncbi:MAG: DUF2357 domain-containing protein [Candidatus Obscuribacterales bacterium]|jgi:hypothetical protein
MDSSPSSRISFFLETGAVIHGPVEGRRCGIAIAIPRELWPSITLKLGTVTLPINMSDPGMCARADWPACGPGNYKLSLACGEITERKIITVVPQLFTEAEFNSIIQDLKDRLPQLITSQLQECGGLSDTNLAVGNEPSIEQEFAKIQRAVSGTKEKLGILQLLPIIQRECHHVLVPRHELRKANQARKPDISKLPQAISMPGNLFPSGALKQMFDVTVERSFETYENRLVKAYVQALQSLMSRLQARLEAEPIPHIAKELDSLIGEFRLACTRAFFLREVRNPFVSGGRVTMVLLKNPAYRAVLEGYLSLFKQSSVRLEEPALDDPLKKFPYLYQRWANLTVIGVLLQVCIDLGYRSVSHPWFQRDHKGLFLPVMKEGEAGIKLSCPITGKVVSIFPWKTGTPRLALGNLELPPAIAIAIYAPEKSPMVLLFDAKYQVDEDTKAAAKKTNSKTNTKLKPAKRGGGRTLSSIEPMREDIAELLHGIEKGRAPDGSREIQYAAILYPGNRKQITSDLEALAARPSERAALEQSVYDVLKLYLS